MWKFWPISSKEPEVSGLLEHFLPPKLSSYMWFKNICNLCAFEMCSFNPTNIWCKIIAQLNVQQMFQKPKKHSQNTAGKFITALGSFDLYYVEGQYYLMYVCWYRARGQGICEFHSTKISPLSYLPVINAADFFFFFLVRVSKCEGGKLRAVAAGDWAEDYGSLYSTRCIEKNVRNENQQSGISSSAGLSQPAVLYEALRRGVPRSSCRHLTLGEKTHLTPQNPCLCQSYYQSERN